MPSGRSTDAYAQLRELIVSGRIPAGARLVETELAKRLGFSRTPVRGALRVLAREGYVRVEGRERRRVRVAPLTLTDARELFELVGAVEGLGARAAAGLPDRRRIRLAAELRGFDDALVAAVARPVVDAAEVYELFTRFPLRYMEAAGPRLRTLHDSIKPQAERYRRLYSTTDFQARVAASVAEHGEIIEAIERGDGEAARRAVEQNWHNAAERLASSIHESDAGAAHAGSAAD